MATVVERLLCTSLTDEQMGEIYSLATLQSATDKKACDDSLRVSRSAPIAAAAAACHVLAHGAGPIAAGSYA